jgi:hypothetical protein
LARDDGQFTIIKNPNNSSCATPVFDSSSCIDPEPIYLDTSGSTTEARVLVSIGNSANLQPTCASSFVAATASFDFPGIDGRVVTALDTAPGTQLTLQTCRDLVMVVGYGPSQAP